MEYAQAAHLILSYHIASHLITSYLITGLHCHCRIGGDTAQACLDNHGGCPKAQTGSYLIPTRIQRQTPSAPGMFFPLSVLLVTLRSSLVPSAVCTIA